jgi:hypothetical protein
LVIDRPFALRHAGQCKDRRAELFLPQASALRELDVLTRHSHLVHQFHPELKCRKRPSLTRRTHALTTAGS